MRHRKIQIISSAIALCLAVQCTVPAKACELTEEELIVKYGSLCEIGKTIFTDTGLEYYAKEKIGIDTIPGSAEVLVESTEDGFRYALLNNGSSRILGLDDAAVFDNLTTLHIPEELGGCTVSEIGNAAFVRVDDVFPNLQEIVIPDTIELIGESAFENAFGYDVSAENSYRINMPKHVRYIGHSAFDGSAFALADSNRTIVLPESLEYISAQAFGDAIGSRIVSWKYSVKMPESLVFMSDDYFHSDAAWNGIAFVREERVEHIPANTLSFTNQNLIRSYFGRGFENNYKNIISMKEILWQYLDVENIETGLLPTDRVKIFVVDPETIINTESSDLLEELRASAEKNAPDLLVSKPEQASLKPVAMLVTSLTAGDVNTDGIIDVSDAVLIARFAAEDREATMTDQGRQNADVTHDGNVDGQDTTKILQYIAKKIELEDLAK